MCRTTGIYIYMQVPQCDRYIICVLTASEAWKSSISPHIFRTAALLFCITTYQNECIEGRGRRGEGRGGEERGGKRGEGRRERGEGGEEREGRREEEREKGKGRYSQLVPRCIQGHSLQLGACSLPQPSVE